MKSRAREGSALFRFELHSRRGRSPIDQPLRVEREFISRCASRPESLVGKVTVGEEATKVRRECSATRSLCLLIGFQIEPLGDLLSSTAEIGIDVTQALIGLWPLRREKRVQAMGCIMLLSALVVRAAIVAALLVFSSTEARAQNPPRLADDNAGHKPFPPIYNPYPSGLLPSDLESEIAR